MRLRYACVVRCDEVVKDDSGRVVELRCSYDPETLGGGTPNGRKVKGTIQWVSAVEGLEAEVRIYGPLFRSPSAGDEDASDEHEDVDLLSLVDPDSLTVVRGARIEPSVADDPTETRYQFERTGYFWRDPVDGRDGALVFNRIVPLKDSWNRKTSSEEAAGGKGGARGSRSSPSDGGSLGPEPGSKPKVSDRRTAVRAEDPELAARFERYQDALGLAEDQADILTGRRAASDFFEAALAEHPDASDVASWMVTDLRGLLEARTVDDLSFDGRALGRLAALVAAGDVTRRAGKDVLARMVEVGGEPAALIEEMGLATLTGEDALGPVIDEVLEAWPEKVAEYRGGNGNLLGLFIGQVMKKTQGAADPGRTRELLTERLDAS